jgi:hypothetical protein
MIIRNVCAYGHTYGAHTYVYPECTPAFETQTYICTCVHLQQRPMCRLRNYPFIHAYITHPFIHAYITHPFIHAYITHPFIHAYIIITATSHTLRIISIIFIRWICASGMIHTYAHIFHMHRVCYQRSKSRHVTPAAQGFEGICRVIQFSSSRLTYPRLRRSDAVFTYSLRRCLQSEAVFTVWGGVTVNAY